MPMQMFFRLPLKGANTNAEAEAEALSIEQQAATLAALFRKEAEDKEAKGKEAAGDDDDDGPAARDDEDEDRRVPTSIERLHYQNGFIDILAWSHSTYRDSNSDRGTFQDISFTAWFEHSTPEYLVATLRGEFFPSGVLRSLIAVTNDTFEVIEFEMKNLRLTSVSTGGSGGEDRFTKNMTVTFAAFSIKRFTISVSTGKIIRTSCGTWDDYVHSGTRDGVSSVPSLASYCKSYVAANQATIPKSERVRLVQAGLSTVSALDIAKTLITRPPRGIRLAIQKYSDMHRNLYREAFFQGDVTVENLKALCAETYGKSVHDVQSIMYCDNRGRLIEIVNAEQVQYDIVDDDTVVVDFKTA